VTPPRSTAVVPDTPQSDDRPGNQPGFVELGLIGCVGRLAAGKASGGPLSDGHPADACAGPRSQGRADFMRPPGLAPPCYELLDAHIDTLLLGPGLVDDAVWRIHLEYLRDLQRVGRETLALQSGRTYRAPLVRGDLL
jgi:hypothetical protein